GGCHQGDGRISIVFTGRVPGRRGVTVRSSCVDDSCFHSEGGKRKSRFGGLADTAKRRSGGCGRLEERSGKCAGGDLDQTKIFLSSSKACFSISEDRLFFSVFSSLIQSMYFLEMLSFSARKPDSAWKAK